jgi:hypothetical protein
MKFTNFLTPQVRTFVYGAVAALLSVATIQNWISADLAQNINDNLPTILGAISSIIAAANVKQKPKAEPIVAPAVPVKVADKPVTHLAQAAATELPL